MWINISQDIRAPNLYPSKHKLIRLRRNVGSDSNEKND